MASEGPYSVVGHPHGGVGIVGPGNDGSYCGMARYQAEEFVGNLNKAYAEGRKSAENYTEKMLVCAKNEVIKCHEEIRRLEDKYARNVYKMPDSSEKDFQELLKRADKMAEICRDIYGSDLYAIEEYEDWKAARGIE